jgi:hypothetical protein
MKHIQFILILLVFNLTGIRAQQLLSKEAALSLTLENNFGIEMTRNINEINKIIVNFSTRAFFQI